MIGINPLFSANKVISDKAKANEVKQGIVIHDKSHEFYLMDEYKCFAKQMQTLEHDKVYEFVSFGQWSLKHVVWHVLSFTGKADVWATTYGLGVSTARGIVDALHSGLIRSFNFVYDWKIRQFKDEAHTLCAANFGVKITSIHAKVCVILNDDFGVVVTGSANWSDSNHKIENTIISTNRDKALFYKDLLTNIMLSKETEPKKIFDDLRTGHIGRY